MYHVIGTGLTAIILYSISYLFYRLGYYSILLHKKIWNSILALAFTITAVAGIFMALQINYKWDMPFVKSVVKWHVEFGAGMAFTGLFHLLWHLSYFTKILKKSENLTSSEEIQKQTSSDITINLFIVGFVSSSIQLLLIREIMIIAGGYELIAGTFLGSWLIASSIGASLAGRSPLRDIKKINLIFFLSPLISLLLLLLLSKLFLKTGETPSFLLSLIYTFLVLIPFCLVSGFTFVKLIFVARSGNNFIPGKSFSLETSGGIAAGIIISMLTSGFLNTYQLLLLIFLLSVAYALLTFFLSNNKARVAMKFAVVLLAASVILFNPDMIFRQILLPAVHVTGSEDTPYGNITEGNYEGERSIYYDQRLLSYSDDAIEREEDIHYAMLQDESPDKVIIVSGSLQSHLREISKYPVKKLIFIERDPALAGMQISDKDTFKGELVIANKDAFRYIRKSKEMVDVIILLIPPPSTLLLNRYYTTEFFQEAKKILNTDGIFMCSPGPGDTYFNKESLNLYSSINNSMTEVFRYVRPVVGNKLYLIASDKEISVSFCNMIRHRGIENIYVSQDYLADDLITKKSDEVRSLFDESVRKNSYTFPVASMYFQSYNFAKKGDEKIVALVLMIILFAVPVVAVKRENLMMYFSASALAGFEIILLLTLQLLVGNMYQLTGLIISGLMTGLAVGAAMEFRLLNSFPLGLKGLVLLAFYTGIGLIYNYILTIRTGFPSVSLLILSSFIPALLTGHIFRELTREENGSLVTSKIYSADLAGSALGFIFISGFAVPVLGIQVSIFLLSALIFTGIVFGTIRNK